MFNPLNAQLKISNWKSGALWVGDKAKVNCLSQYLLQAKVPRVFDHVAEVTQRTCEQSAV